MTQCAHCGELCLSQEISLGVNFFCCLGCKTVYNLLKENQLDKYYDLETKPGITPATSRSFEYLDHKEIQKKIFLYEIADRVAVQFYIPSIHCVSCIWLLEHLYKLCEGIEKCEVNYSRKLLKVQWNRKETSLRQLVELLSHLGYEPQINLDEERFKQERRPIAKLVVAGICFGNIMLFSFPSYFGLALSEHKYFQILCFIFSLPIVFYCARDYLNAFKTFIQFRQVTLDLPIFLGVMALFTQSSYELITQTAFGYWDSLSGLIFFLLLGRYFQDVTFSKLRFDRDYKSFFPVWATVSENGTKKVYPIDELNPGMQIEVKSQEVLPCDAYLLSDEAWVDYRFVTGEAEPVKISRGDLIYAGGRNTTALLKAEVENSVSRSYLTTLWQELGGKKNQVSLSNRIALVFTVSVIIIACIAASFHSQPVLIFSSVVIVACPCALALASPLSLGFAFRFLSEKGLFLKHASVVEQLSNIDHIVFDKTGTLTELSDQSLIYEGVPLDPSEETAVKSLSSQSSHPLSRGIAENLNGVPKEVGKFKEILGAGLRGQVMNYEVCMGSPQFLNLDVKEDGQEVCLAINNDFKGRFKFAPKIRAQVLSMIQNLSVSKSLLSGDHDGQKKLFKEVFLPENMHFRQNPKDKLKFIQEVSNDRKVMMIGDGLNDAGALLESYVGLAVVEEENAFFPASDGLLLADKMVYLPKVLNFAKGIVSLIKLSLLVSILYNVIGLSFAVTGQLTPILSAILMPVSSLTIFLLAACGSTYLNCKHFGQEN